METLPIQKYRPSKGLIVTLGIMACGTILIAFVPDYATIGLMVPILVLIGRLCCKGFPLVSNWAVCLFVYPKWQRRDTKVFM